MVRARISRTGPTPDSSSSDNDLCSTHASRYRPLTRRTLWQNRRLELMIGSNPCGPSGGFRAPSPKRRRPRLRPFPSPSPQPSPPRRGRSLAIRWKIRILHLQSPLLCLSFRSTRQSISVVLPNHGRMFLPLLGERLGLRWNEANSNPRRTTTLGIVKLRESAGRTGGLPI